MASVLSAMGADHNMRGHNKTLNPLLAHPKPMASVLSAMGANHNVRGHNKTLNPLLAHPKPEARAVRGTSRRSEPTF